MITLTKVSYIHEADLICMKLQEAGIEAFIADEMLTSIQPLYSGALGGIRVQVDDKDLEEARAVLGEEPSAEKGIFQCPECGSDSIEFENVSKRSAFLLLFLINIPLTWKKRTCTCRNCGHRWKDRPPIGNG